MKELNSILDMGEKYNNSYFLDRCEVDIDCLWYFKRHLYLKESFVKHNENIYFKEKDY